MADVRALLAAERQARRIQHPHAFYSKAGVLTCSVCQLVIKSDALWDGHLRSANHKKNVQAGISLPVGPNPVPTIPKTSLKRKIEDVDADNDTRDTSTGTGLLSAGDGKPSTKKSKSRQVSFATEVSTFSIPPDDTESSQEPEPINTNITSEETHQPKIPNSSPPKTLQPEPIQQIDEDEWAAFEREVVPLTQSIPTTSNRYSSATISAAPISSADLQPQSEHDQSKRNRPADEAEDEREEEQQRIQGEFEALEELEERVKKLRERREKLRGGSGSAIDPGSRLKTVLDPGDGDGDVAMKSRTAEPHPIRRSQPGETLQEDEVSDRGKSTDANNHNINDEDDDDDDDDDIDDWYS